MPPSVARCVSALLVPVLLAPGQGALAQQDPRDTLIEELRRRVEALEKRLEDRPPAAVVPAAPKPPPSAPTPAASEQAGRDDEDLGALERSLVREGGLVLPRGAIELEPRFQYTYRGSDGVTTAIVNGSAQTFEQELKRNDFEASLGLRIGLPGSFQAEARMPYATLRENRVTAGTLSETQRASGWGDIELGLAKQLFVADRGRMGLLGSLNWKSVTGHHELGRLSVGSGFPQLQAALTAVKREDPLVFFGTASYTRVFERQRSGTDVDPGDAVGLKAGTLLAASPETSLRAAFDFNRFGRTHIGGASVPGSDATVGVLELGLATLLARSTLLDVNVGIGITPDAPDFRIRLSVPIRF